VYMMNKILLAIILTIFCRLTFAQTNRLINQPYDGMPSYPGQTTPITSFAQLPSKIQFIVTDVLKKSMTDFTDNIRFVNGQIIDVENWLRNDSIPQTEYQYIIPTYNLYFELSDTTIGIEKYVFQLNLDVYGQIINFEWPRERYTHRKEFLQPELLISAAKKYAKKNKYKTQKTMYELKYDSQYNCVCWYISFLQKETGDEASGHREYITIAVDYLTAAVLAEYMMDESWASDY
jgi:hypothetical protein